MTDGKLMRTRPTRASARGAAAAGCRCSIVGVGGLGTAWAAMGRGAAAWVGWGSTAVQIG